MFIGREVHDAYAKSVIKLLVTITGGRPISESTLSNQYSKNNECSNVLTDIKGKA